MEANAIRWIEAYEAQQPDLAYVDVKPKKARDGWRKVSIPGNSFTTPLESAITHDDCEGYVFDEDGKELLCGPSVMWRDEDGELYHYPCEGGTKEICKAVRFVKREVKHEA